MKSFENWTYEEVENSFGLTRQASHDALTAWLDVTRETISAEETRLLQFYQANLHEQARNWNEEELKLFFIGPILTLVNYHHKKYNPFSDRKLTTKIGEIEVGGVVDFMVAAGQIAPHHPYFCLHEYKPKRGRHNDPEGQLLVAMLCGQVKNQRPVQPLYGVIVEGTLWYFMVLVDQVYAVSDSFTATKDDLFTIFKALKRVKILIEPFLS